MSQELSEARSIKACFPKDPHWSPLKFNLFFLDIPSHPRVMSALYADDIGLINSDGCSYSIAGPLPISSDILSRLENHQNGNSFSCPKYRALSLFQNDCLVEIGQDLRVVLDNRLSYCKKIQYASTKAMKTYFPRKTFSNNGRVSEQLKLRAFKAAVRSQ